MKGKWRVQAYRSENNAWADVYGNDDRAEALRQCMLCRELLGDDVAYRLVMIEDEVTS